MELETGVRNIVVIGGSAGGIEAVIELLQVLPADFPAAVLVVIHMPAHTPSRLCEVLANRTALKVVVGLDEQVLESGTVYVASTDRHLLLRESGIRITRGPKECRVRPAVDALFRSAAAAFGPRVVGVVLSGMLDDGTAGLWAIKDRGGIALVQEPTEAAYDSMPLSAIAGVDVDFVGTVAALREKLLDVVGEPVGVQAEAPPRAGHVIENDIAMEGNGLKAGVMDLGIVSQYTCPDCHGVLVQIEEGRLVRFRCHTGHAFTLKTLIAEVNAAIDTGLWDTLRAVEERVMLLRQMAGLAEDSGDQAVANKCRRQAVAAEERLEPLRSLLLDPDFFGHDPVD